VSDKSQCGSQFDHGALSRRGQIYHKELSIKRYINALGITIRQFVFGRVAGQKSEVGSDCHVKFP
jgi:hypothetical protein